MAKYMKNRTLYTTNPTECQVPSVECTSSVECQVSSVRRVPVECPSSERRVPSSERRVPSSEHRVSSSDRRVTVTQWTLDGHSTDTRRTLDGHLTLGTRHSTDTRHSALDTRWDWWCIRLVRTSPPVYGLKV